MQFRRRHGFTLIELLVAMAIIATLLSIAAPRHFGSLERAREAALKTDLRVLREAIDKYRADTGRWPGDLEALVRARYLRAVPVDPITDRADTWVIVVSGDPGVEGVSDVQSGAPGAALDGAPYASW